MSIASHPITRRSVLVGAGVSGLGVFAAGFSDAKAWALPRSHPDPFTLGVASGDPTPDGAVLWTRLAPDPLDLDSCGGMPPKHKVMVHWQVARDRRFRSIVREGRKFAVPELAHSIHVEVSGLEPGREYFYRFRSGSFESPVGRTKTAPAAGTALRELRFGVVACQKWQSGLYTAYRHLAEDDLEVVFHIGDYIYESAIPQGGLHRHQELPAKVRAKPWTLSEYRLRHALVRIDPDLQAAHAQFPFVVTWDDHDVASNWAGDNWGPDWVTEERFRRRRAAAVQAYYEQLPLRLPQKPHGADVRFYRRLTYGDLATFHVLDERMYRDDQACGDGQHAECPERLDPSRTMLGFPQEQWLYDGLTGSGTAWNLIANQDPLAQYDLDPGPEHLFWMDPWDGYKPARDRLFDAIDGAEDIDTVVFTGDRHAHHAANLKTNFDDPDSRTVSVEFVSTSISSGEDGEDKSPYCETVLAANEHIKLANAQRGYLRMTATPDSCRADHLVVPYVSRPGAPISTRASFVTEAGNPGVQLDTEDRS